MDRFSASTNKPVYAGRFFFPKRNSPFKKCTDVFGKQYTVKNTCCDKKAVQYAVAGDADLSCSECGMPGFLTFGGHFVPCISVEDTCAEALRYPANANENTAPVFVTDDTLYVYKSEQKQIVKEAPYKLAVPDPSITESTDFVYRLNEYLVATVYRDYGAITVNVYREDTKIFSLSLPRKSMGPMDAVIGVSLHTGGVLVSSNTARYYLPFEPVEFATASVRGLSPSDFERYEQQTALYATNAERLQGYAERQLEEAKAALEAAKKDLAEKKKATASATRNASFFVRERQRLDRKRKREEDGEESGSPAKKPKV
ncbi:MAG: hypothetical protein CMK92_03635 [Pseudomonas sp.]|nr:hypothetical protein [Pseudomonas sp.]